MSMTSNDVTLWSKSKDIEGEFRFRRLNIELKSNDTRYMPDRCPRVVSPEVDIRPALISPRSLDDAPHHIPREGRLLMPLFQPFEDLALPL